MWLELQIFGFRALWSPYYMIFVLALAVAYYLLTGPYRGKFGGAEKPTTKQQICFYTAMVLLYLIKGSPVDLLTHIMLTAHMIQMAIYYLIFPILIIRGIPVWIWRKFLSFPVIKPFVKLFTKPLIALLLFNTLFSLYHIPDVFDFAKSSPIIHAIVSTVILVAAFIVWWPMVTPVKEYDTIPPILKIAYIFANGVLITPACVLIIFADVPLFATYSDGGAWIQALSLCVPVDVLNGLSGALTGPEMFSPMTTLEDQQLGGIIMKLMQEITYGCVLARIFFTWFSRESLKVDPIPEPSSTN
ncbi:cytochrome c oxidase assembly factor CtaG [Virgibacillus phasianinus]|uniref:Cytochrome c oxidase assembly factor CtaG n=1 Tax=Virgibacillus phasianinus TaxID=2017483 RepID=A0A220U6Y7_9BACI|nr:cytochrome c oxidase assembly factor CtaG [Virgibacillus phasianinus]ASK63611.1 cytochrome c oxidase assembly factor CtaG [Virgibacillus phasianinus]